MAQPDAGRLRRRAFWLTAVTMAWTVACATAAITAGVIASSLALLGLGLESVIELCAAALVIWALRRGGKDHELRAIRVIAVMFLASAVYVLAESIHELADQSPHEHSPVGLAVAAAALVIMPALAAGKRRTGQSLSSRLLIADAAETAMCAVAAAAALVATGLDAWLGWWWAVAAAGLVIAALGIKDGFQFREPHP